MICGNDGDIAAAGIDRGNQERAVFQVNRDGHKHACIFPCSEVIGKQAEWCFDKVYSVDQICVSAITGGERTFTEIEDRFLRINKDLVLPACPYHTDPVVTMLPFTDQKRWGGKIFDLPVCQLDQVYILCPVFHLGCAAIEDKQQGKYKQQKRRFGD